jgi:hypothetical protein
MIDYLLRYPDEVAAMAALPTHTLEGIEPGVRLWDTTYVLPDVKAYRITGTETVDDGMGSAYEREIRDHLPGWYIWVARAERDPALEGEACVLVASAETGDILFTITTVEDLETLGIGPMFAGRPYLIGAPVMAPKS